VRPAPDLRTDMGVRGVFRQRKPRGVSVHLRHLQLTAGTLLCQQGLMVYLHLYFRLVLNLVKL